MKEYSSWYEIPEGLKTKNNLIKMGIYKMGEPVAVVKTKKGIYELYDVNKALEQERKRGNKSISIEPQNQDRYLIMEMATTGDGKNDEIIQLVLLDMNGKLLINQYFKPRTQISKAAMARHQINSLILKRQPQWDEVWPTIKEYIENRVILIPNTSYGIRLFEQTCKRYDVHLDFQLNCICSRETIQHKFSLMKLFETPELEVQDPLKDSYETLKILYPKSPLYVAQTKAKNYFDKLCQYKIKKGDVGGYDKGYKWLQTEFRLSSEELDFDALDYEICLKSVDSLEPPVQGLGLL